MASTTNTGSWAHDVRSAGLRVLWGSFLIADQLWFGKDRLRNVEEEVLRLAAT
jgi:2-hydroxychromene-2-carboxylate isomerase